jgi:16S rRNA (cytosine967-C5)-methyltransferase
MISPARTAAFHALRAVAAGRADLPSALSRSRDGLSDHRDRALAAEITTGTLRWQRTADHLIEHFARRRLSKIDDDVLVILRLSVYQLLHLDRVPASAVVDDAVTMTRAARKQSAAGFVNAVLRSLLRERHRLPLPARPSDASDRAAAIAYLSITHSHPEWLVSRWLDRYGFDGAEQWVRFNNETPHLTIRANRLRTTRDALCSTLAQDGILSQSSRYAPDGLIVTDGNPLSRPVDGTFFVQDETSQLVPLMLGARAGERVLDLCASPGGKATALAAEMEDAGLIVASDVRPRRVKLLAETVRSSGARCVRVACVGTSGPLPFRHAFDRVLVDAPCSGLGTVRRDPDIRWRRSEADLAALARDQIVLLDRAADVVKPGGRLVYATCSGEPEETDAVVAAFLETHQDFALSDVRSELAALTPLFDGRGILRTLPHRDRLEAFFAAALTRRASS